MKKRNFNRPQTTIAQKMISLEQQNEFLKKKVKEFQEIMEKQNEVLRMKEEEIRGAKRFLWSLADILGPIKVEEAKLLNVPEKAVLRSYMNENKQVVFEAKLNKEEERS